MSGFAIRYPFFIIVLCLMVAIVGTVTLVRMPVDLFPPIKIPVVVVATFFSGMPPEQIETDITGRFERFFTLASGIDHLESRSARITSAALRANRRTGRARSRSRISCRGGRSSAFRSSRRTYADIDMPSMAALALSRRCSSAGTLRIWTMVQGPDMLTAYFHHFIMSTHAAVSYESQAPAVPMARKTYELRRGDAACCLFALTVYRRDVARSWERFRWLC